MPKPGWVSVYQWVVWLCAHCAEGSSESGQGTGDVYNDLKAASTWYDNFFHKGNRSCGINRLEKTAVAGVVLSMGKAEEREERGHECHVAETALAAPLAAGWGLGHGILPLAPVLLLAVVAAARFRKRRYLATLEGSGSDEFFPPDPEPWQFGRTLFCPVCTAEYLAEAERCDDCGVHLVEEEDLGETEDARIDEGIVRILRIASGAQSQLLRALFAMNRIPCTLVRCSPCDVFGTDVFVFESDVLRAKRLVRQFVPEKDILQIR